MYYSITFWDGQSFDSRGNVVGINTWKDWGLIPSSRPTIVTAQPTINMVKVPGRTDMIDLTEYLRGRPLYGNRTGSLDFYVTNGYDTIIPDYKSLQHNNSLYPKNAQQTWMQIRQSITNALHGKKIKMVLEDDPKYYYEGRFQFNSWKSDAAHSRVVIDYQLGPYKYSIYPIGNIDDIWDTFNFEQDCYENTLIWMKYNPDLNNNTGGYNSSTSTLSGGHQVVYKLKKSEEGLL